MIEDLKSLRREIDSLRSAIRAYPRVFIRDQRLIDRIEELFLAWSTGARPGMAASGVPPEVLGRADAVFSTLTRLTSRASKKSVYERTLQSLRRVLVEQVLLEVARISTATQLAPKHPIARSLIPEIPDVSNELIPKALLGWISNLQDFLKQHSFDRNVFIMVAYRRRLAPLIQTVQDELQLLSLNPIIAREHRLTDDLYNPLACLLCCNYGIAIFDRGDVGQRHNPNVVYELAMMHLLKRPCIILKHRSLSVMPADLLQRLYEDYNSNQDAARIVRDWWLRITRR